MISYLVLDVAEFYKVKVVSTIKLIQICFCIHYGSCFKSHNGTITCQNKIWHIPYMKAFILGGLDFQWAGPHCETSTRLTQESSNFKLLFYLALYQHRKCGLKSKFTQNKGNFSHGTKIRWESTKGSSEFWGISERERVGLQGQNPRESLQYNRKDFLIYGCHGHFCGFHKWLLRDFCWHSCHGYYGHYQALIR